VPRCVARCAVRCDKAEKRVAMVHRKESQRPVEPNAFEKAEIKIERKVQCSDFRCDLQRYLVPMVMRVISAGESKLSGHPALPGETGRRL
jgi:hypothetical protein